MNNLSPITSAVKKRMIDLQERLIESHRLAWSNEPEILVPTLDRDKEKLAEIKRRPVVLLKSLRHASFKL